MKSAIRNLSGKFFIALALLAALIFLQLSCTKIDTENDSAQTSNLASDVTQKFFSLPSNASYAIQRIATEMKSEMIRVNL